MAETAVVVHEDYRRLGFARYLLRQLECHALKQGIEGFYSEILPINEAMLNYHRGLGHSLVFSQETDTYHMEFRFKKEGSEAKKSDVESGGVSAQQGSRSGFSG